MLSRRECYSENLDRIVPGVCILASNSSSIIPSELVPSDARKKNFIGLHFFYPIAIKNVTEIIKTPDTSRETIDFTKKFLKKINRRWL